MMKNSRLVNVVIGVVVVAAISLDLVAGQQYYDSKFDDVDVNAILANPDERNKYTACIMDTGPCHNEMAVFLKDKSPEALVTSCKYCTDKQLKMFETVISWYVDNSPAEWNSLVEKVIDDAKKRGLHQ